MDPRMQEEMMCPWLMLEHTPPENTRATASGGGNLQGNKIPNPFQPYNKAQLKKMEDMSGEKNRRAAILREAQQQVKKVQEER
jgi:hypothetical protein